MRKTVQVSENVKIAIQELKEKMNVNTESEVIMNLLKYYHQEPKTIRTARQLVENLKEIIETNKDITESPIINALNKR